MALRLAQVTGMGADFWLGLQQDWDLWHALRSEVDVAALEQLLGRLPPEARHLILLLCRSGFSNRQLGDAIREAGGEELLDGETEQTRVLVPRFADSELAALWTAAVGPRAGQRSVT